MNYIVKTVPTFVTQLKQILGKYPKIKEDIGKYLRELEVSGVKGVQIPSKSVPGKQNKHGFYKDKLPLEPYNIGKRGGLRLICYRNPAESSPIILAMVYLKSELENPTNQMFKNFLSEIKSL
jgi:hypothetical protein